MATIKFGTSGWRAPIADGFNAGDLEKLSKALALHVLENPNYGFQGDQYQRYCRGKGISHVNPMVIVGYDTRFMSEHYARVVADTLAEHAISVKLSACEAPTPVVAWSVVESGAVGGVTITASEGAYQFNGLKWTPFWGGPAIPEVTDDIEQRVSGGAAHPSRPPVSGRPGSSLIELVDLHKGYFKKLSSMLDLNRLKKSGLKIGVDPIHGSITTYLRPYIDGLGLKTVGIHETRDVLFGGKSPYTGPESLAELSRLVLKNRLDIGLACDCDGDRFGIVDADGEWVSPNEILAIVLEHLVTNRGIKGRVCRSVVTSYLVDAVAKSHGLEVRETPVGFKYVGELMRTGQYILGGEESGGLSIAGHVPEKDGILACLLVLEAMAFEKKPLKKIRQALWKKHGQFTSVKFSVPTKDLNVSGVIEKLKVRPPLDLAGFSVWRIDQTDGFKFILKDGSWLGLRPSGTEPIVRIYAEATSKQKLEKLAEEGKKILKGKF